MSFKKGIVRFLPALKGQANRVSSDVIMKDQIQTLIQEHKERLDELSLFLNDISAIKNKNTSIEEQRLITETINELELEKSLRLSFISDLENLC